MTEITRVPLPSIAKGALGKLWLGVAAAALAAGGLAWAGLPASVSIDVVKAGTGPSPTVEDVVNGVLFLVSDLSRTVTGTTLHVDGGTWAAFGFLDWPEGDSFMPAPLGGTLKKLVG